MKKIGILALALVMALGALGIGYAAWTDTVTINGTVNTGDVDLEIVALSSTWVYKVPGAQDTGDGFETVVNHALIPAPRAAIDPSPPTNGELIASATAYFVSWSDIGDNIVTITYDNLFPSIDFVADVLIRYDGSIPVRISIADFTLGTDTDPRLAALWAAGEQTDGTGAWIDWWVSNASGGKSTLITDPLGIQLHEGDYILIEGVIHLPQDTALMNLSGSFTANVEVIQWNEYNNEEPSNG